MGGRTCSSVPSYNVGEAACFWRSRSVSCGGVRGIAYDARQLGQHPPLTNLLDGVTRAVQNQAGLPGQLIKSLPSQSFHSPGGPLQTKPRCHKNESNKDKTMQNKWQHSWEEEGDLGHDLSMSVTYEHTSAHNDFAVSSLPVCVCSFLAQRKELGVLVYNCSCLALDLHRVFSFYWQLHERDYIPSIWSKRVTALYGRHDALELRLNGSQAIAYVSVRINSVMLPHLLTCHPINWLYTKCSLCNKFLIFL